MLVELWLWLGLGLGLELGLGLGLELELGLGFGLGLGFERLQLQRNSQFNPNGPFRPCYFCLLLSPIYLFYELSENWKK